MRKWENVNVVVSVETYKYRVKKDYFQNKYSTVFGAEKGPVDHEWDSQGIWSSYVANEEYQILYIFFLEL